ncbi:DNA polymerase III subunit delta' [Helicobacter cappadocius]|uniref:DNA polymerase III subunit delta n=1 Tax=Helicobacter cappadocius TaxID=3063998 RepID=A0AA90Q014_9HELI|nr:MULTISPECIES: DNA polymerase III subunit delta' [unclassified Helicobacter]MDO7253669.1 DNA polymerase III subunit delta' [Helicobacter sp. faydin-H75]MDP2539643.1 DNA polymerase III subunit delta' [Helicobacter sp. faydin-H76]
MEQAYSGMIVLNSNISQEASEQSKGISPAFLRLFERDEFKIEDSHEVINEAYIASEELKTIIIAANSYNHFAQNALLKVLEEPPSKTRFILIAKNKTSILPTIRSRLQIQDNRNPKIFEELDIDLKNLSLKSIYNFLKSLDSAPNPSRDTTKEKIQSLLFMIKKLGISFNEGDLKSFDEALEANANYQKDSYIFLPLLLMVLRNLKAKNAKK